MSTRNVLVQIFATSLRVESQSNICSVGSVFGRIQTRANSTTTTTAPSNGQPISGALMDGQFPSILMDGKFVGGLMGGDNGGENCGVILVLDSDVRFRYSVR